MKCFVDIHHVVAWPQGRTEYDNLITVCRVHHGLIHKLGWTVTFEEGHANWFRPLGSRYEPGPAPPDPPETPQRPQVSLAEAATYAGVDRFIAMLAAPSLARPQMPTTRLRTRAAREIGFRHRSVV